MNNPFLIKGGIFNDDRGRLRYVNDFQLENIKRFYTITQSPENGPRAWQGHKTESKYFYCLKGSFTLKLIRIENWDYPDDSHEVASYNLTELSSEILAVPGGYANGVMALEKSSQLLIFSEKTLEEAKGDEIKFDKDKWNNWKKL